MEHIAQLQPLSSTTAVRRTLCLACALATWICAVQSAADWHHSNLDAGMHEHGPLLAESFGVHHAQLFALAPVHGVEKFVLLNVWLKRISPGGRARASRAADTSAAVDVGRASSRYLLPTQTDMVEGFAWADDLDNLTSSMWMRFMTPVDVSKWKPRLRLQVWGSNYEVLPTYYPPSYAPVGEMPPPWSHLVPFRFTFKLDDRPDAREATCFKVYEESMPDNRAPFCLPLTTPDLCNRLAPDASFTPTNPALWAVLVPFRTFGMVGVDWEPYLQHRVVPRLQHYLSYLHAIGATGILLYVDHFMAHSLRRFSEVRQMVLDGGLVFVEWEFIERMDFGSDQKLVYSHAFLGLSSCGANLWVQIADIDELLYSPSGDPWPTMLDCMSRSAGSPRDAAVFRSVRYDSLAAQYGTEREAELWSIPPGGDDDGGGRAKGKDKGKGTGKDKGRGTGKDKGKGMHPFMRYDLLSVVPYPENEGKFVACPARRMKTVVVHNAVPADGSWHGADPACAIFLHLVNFWEQRVGADNGTYTPFKPLTAGPLLV